MRSGKEPPERKIAMEEGVNELATSMGKVEEEGGRGMGLDSSTRALGCPDASARGTMMEEIEGGKGS